MKIELSAWKEEDISFLIQYANNFRVWETLRNSFPHPYTKKDAEEWVNSNLHNNPISNFAIKADGKTVGGAGVILKSDIYIKNAEIGYWIAEPFWGKGIATAVISQLVTYIFSNLDIIRIYAEVFSNNPASMKALAKNGFQQEAILQKSIFKNNQLLDTYIWVKFRPD